jgi:hypothetical protein
LKWLEIIDLRANTSNRGHVLSELTRMIKEFESPANKPRFCLYRHAYIETDFSIHLIHDSESISVRGGPIGHHVASVLKEFGIIHRTIWVLVNDQGS